jgi:hypothetical protein
MPAPAPGTHEQLDIFGRPTGIRVEVKHWPSAENPKMTQTLLAILAATVAAKAGQPESHSTHRGRLGAACLTYRSHLPASHATNTP